MFDQKANRIDLMEAFCTHNDQQATKVFTTLIAMETSGKTRPESQPAPRQSS
jgi:hypothetical protein